MKGAINIIWILEKQITPKTTLYYAGGGHYSPDIKIAFHFGTEGLANEFLSRTKTDPRIEAFSDFIPTEYSLQKVRK